MTPIYRASTTLLINEARTPTAMDISVLDTSARLAKTYAERFTKRPVLEEVSARLGLDIEADEFAVDIVVSPVRDTQLIELNVESSDPQLAMDIANTLPEVFIERNTEMLLSRFASSKENLSKQLAIIESDVEATQQAINDLQDSDSATDTSTAPSLRSGLRLSTSQAELARLQTPLDPTPKQLCQSSQQL